MFSKDMIVKEYNSIYEFTQFLDNTPRNMFADKMSTNTSKPYWSGTKDYAEAMKLLKHGCPQIASRIESKLKVESKKALNAKVRNVPANAMAGYQVNVPRYLNGMPDSMVNTVRKVQKDKVVNVIKQISFLQNVSAYEVEDEAVKCLEFVKAVEQQGQRVNLWICRGNDRMQDNICLVKIKGANERANISKIAFPIAHISMMRRMMFAWQEKYPGFKDYRIYGSSWENKKLVEWCNQYRPGWIVFGNNLGIY